MFAQKSVSTDTFPLQALIVKGKIKTSDGAINPGDFMKVHSLIKIKKNGHLIAIGTDGRIFEISDNHNVKPTKSIKKTWKGYSHTFLVIHSLEIPGL